MTSTASEPDQILGDPLPDILIEFWENLADGRFVEAASCFGPSGVHAVGPAGGDETAPRTVSIGPAQIEQQLQRATDPSGGTCRACASPPARVVLVEGVLHDGQRPIGTVVCSVTVGADGLIDRYLAFSCRVARVIGSRPTCRSSGRRATRRPSSTTTSPASTRATSPGPQPRSRSMRSTPIRRTGTPASTTRTGSSSAVGRRWRRRSTPGGRRRSTTRSSRSGSVVRTACSRARSTTFRDGGSGSFISSLSLADDGTIRRYVSFYCEPGVLLS